ncbi:MAG TPA: alpha/beta hydrolase [Acidimicrobiales bacterium]|nr:alpha/beta hydrolase [Acidimicrobiales bacterium]
MTPHPNDIPVLPRGELRPLAGRGEVFVRVAGSEAAPPVLLLHGWQATADLNFFGVYEALAAQFRVIAPDLRGHGRSLYPERRFTMEDAADDCAALLGDLGVPSVVVVGYSLGGAVAQTIADRHPDLIDGLVLAASDLAPAAHRRDKVANRVGGWLGTIQRMTSGRAAAHQILTRSTRECPAMERYRGWFVGELERGHAGSMRAAGVALLKFDGRPLAARKRDLPVATVITRRDRLIPVARQEGLAAAWRATIVDLDADHDAPIAQPAPLAAALIKAIGAVSGLLGERAVVA